jgi:tRNA dimethylallyltransferase
MLPCRPEQAPFYLCGPTASGKSGLALALAERLGAEIINADAFQLYRGLDVLTAKPSAADLARWPHHLFSVLEPAEACDAQRYRELALAQIQRLHQRGRRALIVGGSGLYLKALSHGLAPLPAADEALRAELRELPLTEKVAQLLTLDPDAAQNVPLSNPRYVERALEICLLTGQPQSSLRRSFAEAQPWGQGLLLVRERAELHERIHARVHEMLEAGALEEVAALDAATPVPLMNGVAKAIGIRELRAHLAGECTREQAIAAIQQATRQYAKRQMTWFRRETWLQTICLQADAAPESAIEQMLTHFSSFSS